MRKEWLVCSLLLVFISGTTCFWDIVPEEFCTNAMDSKCGYLLDPDIVPLFPVKKSEVPKFCSNMAKYYTCIDYNYSAKDLCGRPLIMKSAETMVLEFCSKRTSLHNRFLRNIKCMNNSAYTTGKECSSMGELAFAVLKGQPANRAVFELDFEFKRCFKHAFNIECYGRAIMEDCGWEAQTTYKEMTQRSSYYTAKCRDYKQHSNATQALIFFNHQVSLYSLRNPGDNLPTKLA
ncbi:hypothetical protein NPIL_68391 [Nephila pilipes]|uniref:DUF19 domain-containing protein n=1 Tax=Nephila pilipes TaxID=299642 RepID=A0A8X6K0L3_NEPPI|nr:hypothetical protein NPIL_68391 [Nephila pilipes]